jgi:predicted Zn-dependent peptidase
MQTPDMPSKRIRVSSDKGSAATRFLDEFGGKPDKFYAFLGVERYEGKLNNGVSVILFKKPGARLNFSVASVGGGSFDPEELQGRAHFNEHMLLSGTFQYPRKDLLVKPIEVEGGTIGATTSDEYLRVNVSLNDPNDLPLARDIAAQCLTQSLYDPNTIETERNVIQQEIELKHANPEKWSFEVYKQAFYPGTPLGRSVLGTKESVARLTREQLMLHSQQMFVGKRMALIAAGNITLDQLLQEAEQGFGNLPDGEPIAETMILPLIREGNGIVIHSYTDTEKVFFHLGFRTVEAGHPDRGALSLIAEVLGGGRASLLNQMVRYAKDTGWVYSIRAYKICYGSAGTFTVYAATTKKHLQQAFDAIMRLYDRIRQQGLSLEEIEFAKNKLIKRTMGGYETTSSWVENHLHQALAAIHPHPQRTQLSLQYPLYDFIHQIATVTSEDTQRIAEKYFRDGELRLAICGNVTPNDFKIDF